MRQTIACHAALVRIELWARDCNLDFRHEEQSGFGAVFSRCGTWRHLLWRMHHPRGRLLGMGLLNPSTADETEMGGVMIPSAKIKAPPIMVGYRIHLPAFS